MGTLLRFVTATVMVRGKEMLLNKNDYKQENAQLGPITTKVDGHT